MNLQWKSSMSASNIFSVASRPTRAVRSLRISRQLTFAWPGTANNLGEYISIASSLNRRYRAALLTGAILVLSLLVGAGSTFNLSAGSYLPGDQNLLQFSVGPCGTFVPVR